MKKKLLLKRMEDNPSQTDFIFTKWNPKNPVVVCLKDGFKKWMALSNGDKCFIKPHKNSSNYVVAEVKEVKYHQKTKQWVCRMQRGKNILGWKTKADFMLDEYK